MLTVRLRKQRGPFALDVAFDAPTPGVVALFGASGSGKTTVIDLIAGLLRPDAGRVEIDGDVLFEAGRTDLAPERRAVGYVFQDARLFPHRSVLGNLRYGERRAARRPATASFEEIVLRWRAPARRDRARAPLPPAAPAARRAARLDRPRAQAGAAAVPGAAPRPLPHSDRVREPPVRGGAAARDARRPARGGQGLDAG
jgi:molybdate transport system ATP-binding protein